MPFKRLCKLKTSLIRLCSAAMACVLVLGLCGVFAPYAEAATTMTGREGTALPEVKTTIRNLNADEKALYALLFSNNNANRKDGVHNWGTNPDNFTDVDGSLDQSMPVLLKTLDANGYPQLKKNDRGYDIAKMNELYGTNSLEPIFNNTNGNNTGSDYSQTYTAANTLFKYDSATERYVFNSAENHVYFNTSTKKFTVYDQPLRPYSITTDYGYDTFGAFLPFNSTNGVIQVTDSNGNKMPGVTYGDGGVSWNDEASHAANMFVTPESGDNIADDWFVMTVEFSFFIPEDGKIGGQDMVFRFSGDDDVWVYVDDVLVVDQGGTHKHTDSYVNFATGEVGYQKYDKGANIAGLDGDEAAAKLWPWTYTTIKKCFEEAATETGDSSYNEADKFNGNTFADYSVHTLTFFFMERGGDASNCKLDFNLPIIPSGALTVHKSVDGYLTEDANREYTFILKDKDGNIISNAEYSVITGSGNVTTGKSTDSSGRFKLKANESAVFEDIEAGVDYSIIQLEELSDSNYETYVSDTDCTVDREAVADNDTSAGFNTGNFEVNYKDTCLVTFTNHLRQDKKITVTKETGQYISDDESFTFNAQIEGFDSPVTFTLKNGESKTIENIPVGAKVVVTETVPEGMEASNKLSGADSYTDGNKHTVTALTQNTTVNFHNKLKLMNVTVKKLIDGSLGNKKKEFEFKINIKHGQTDINTITMNLSDGEETEISNIPYGATVTISENSQDYTATVKCGNDEAQSDTYTIEKLTENTDVTFTNVKDGAPNTGVLLDSVPYIILLTLAVAGAVIFTVRRRAAGEVQ